MARQLARRLARLLSALLLLALALSNPDPAVAATPTGAVVEQLRLQVPAEAVPAWLEAERNSWAPWLAQQPGFLRRELLWDPARQEATLLIHWASREQWKAIPSAEVERVQLRFEELARQASGQPQGNPFPLIFEGELQPLG